MGKILTFVIGAILGVIIGGLLVFYTFGGVPRAAQVPGEPIQPPDANGVPAGTATIVLNQQFFNEILTTIFQQMNEPSFQLGANQNNFADPIQPRFASYALMQQNGNCPSQIQLKPEGSGVKTGVRLEEGKITAPLAFSGNYLLGGQCLQFAGWAQANLALRFDKSQQAVYGQLNISTINLDGISPLFTSLVTPVIQTTLNNRVNPITILRGEQIALNLPIAAANGNLKANVSDVRADIKDNALNLFVTYDFAGTKGIQQ